MKWRLECIKDRRIPAFETDSIGNAQELVRAFNLWTEIPVIIHPRIARINKVYESRGIGLRYVDASTGEALKLTEEQRYVVIVPRQFDTARYGNFRTAYVSAQPVRGADVDRKVFPLGDQADLHQLLQFVTEARLKSVLTFFGASDQFAQMISKRLGIPARQLTTEVRRKKQVIVKLDERRVLRCQEIILKAMETPDYAYDKSDLVALGLKEEFRVPEVEEALQRLTKNRVLKYSNILDGYTRA